MVPSLYAPMDTWPKVSSLSTYAPSSSIQAAEPWVATTGILRSPVLVVITCASWRKMFCSCSASTRVRSNSSGTR